MAITLYIANGLYSIKKGTLSIIEALGQRSTCEFVIDNPDGSITPPRVGQSVAVYDGAYLVFGGSVESVDASRYKGTYAGQFRVSCVDHHRILERRITGTRTWENEYAGTIVADICTSWLGGEGVGLTFIQQGPIIESFSVDHVPIAEAISEVADLSGYRWLIDYGKELRFFQPMANQCPFHIEPDGTNYTDLAVRATRENYANKATARIERLIRAPQTAQFDSNGRTGTGEDPLPWMVPDGSRRRFSVTYPIYEQPEIRVNSVLQTVGKRGQEQAQWYWMENSDEVQQDESETALSSTDILTITYRGLSQGSVTVSMSGEISRRAAVEGHTGIYEIGAVEREALTAEAVEQKLTSELKMRSRLGNVMQITTNSEREPLAVTARAGQYIHVDCDGYRVHWYDVSAVAYGSPCIVTIPQHGLKTGEKVRLHNVQNLDGAWTITVISEDTFSLNNSNASGTYSGGGFAFPLTCLIRQVRVSDYGSQFLVVNIEAVSGHGAADAVSFFQGLGGTVTGGTTIITQQSGGGGQQQEHQIVIVDGADPLVQGNDLSDSRYRVLCETGYRLRLLEWTAALKKPGLARVRIMRSNDGGATWASIFPSPGYVEINGSLAAGSTFAVQTLSRFDLLRYDLTEAQNGASGLHFSLRCRKESI